MVSRNDLGEMHAADTPELEAALATIADGVEKLRAAMGQKGLVGPSGESPSLMIGLPSGMSGAENLAVVANSTAAAKLVGVLTGMPIGEHLQVLDSALLIADEPEKAAKDRAFKHLHHGLVAVGAATAKDRAEEEGVEEEPVECVVALWLPAHESGDDSLMPVMINSHELVEVINAFAMMGEKHKEMVLEATRTCALAHHEDEQNVEEAGVLREYLDEQQRRCEEQGLCVTCKGVGSRPAWGEVNPKTKTRPFTEKVCVECKGSGKAGGAS